MEEQKVAIILLNWNGWRDTLASLESVRRLSYSNYQIIVLDNGSSDDSIAHLLDWGVKDRASRLSQKQRQHVKVALLKHRYDGWTDDEGSLTNGQLAELASNEDLILIHCDGNLGFTGGCNLAVEFALLGKPAYVWFLNNDAKVSTNALNALLDGAKSAQAAIVGGHIMDESGARTSFAGSRWPGRLFNGSRRISKTELSKPFWDSSDASGCALLAHESLLRRRINDCGYVFDPRFFMYCEDLDLCLFAKTRGYKCVIARDAVIYHGLSKSSGGDGNPRVYYYITRNRIYLVNRWLSRASRIGFHLYYIPSRILLQAYHSLRRARRGVTSAVVEGLVDGYRGIGGKWSRH